jgi:hypothetical protein
MRWPVKQPKEWNTWFAWHPVEIEGTNIWLEKVERKIKWCDMYCTWYEYREIGDERN